MTHLLHAERLSRLSLALYKVEVELERQITASLLHPGDDVKVRHIFQEDIGVDKSGINVHPRGNEIHDKIPITVDGGPKALQHTHAQQSSMTISDDVLKVAVGDGHHSVFPKQRGRLLER